jgi:hypothetical protein
MYQSELDLPSRFRAAPVRIDVCTWQALYLVADGDHAPLKAQQVRCLPDTQLYSAEGVDDHRQYPTYRKVRVGDGIVKLAILAIERDTIHGLLQVDRIASGKAIPTNSLSEFHLTADELDELILALLNTRLIELDPTRLTSLQREAYRARCAEWDLPAKDATSIDVWRTRDVVGR